MIHSIHVNEFRALKDVTLNLGKYITVISGRNGLCKSTILALLGNTCELKVKDGKSIFNTQFRTEFGEIFKANKKFDPSGSNKFWVNFYEKNSPDVIREKKISRVSWQGNGTRFRVIPETKEKGLENSKKMEWPSLYLGLSRLYPIGEADDKKMKVKSVPLSEDEQKYFLDNYVEILNLNNEEELCIDMIDIDEVHRKKGIGINTSKYSSITNSAGQDNVGQIIMSVLSFKRLKKSYERYEGGLLLIDEIDATLHPVAQIKLIQFLYKACKELDLQVVCTTHSVSLLEDIAIKIIHNTDNINNYEVYYLTNNNGPLVVLRNPEFPVMKSDLMLSKPGQAINKIPVYSEDDEGRWFLRKLTKKYGIFLNYINIRMGCTELISLNNNDPIYFSNVLFVLDGDVPEKNIEMSKLKDNIIKLPGKVRPEQIFYDYLIKLDSSSELWSIGAHIGFNKDSIIENGPESSKYKGKPREKYKEWFKENVIYFENLDVFDYWCEDNKEEVDEFIDKFIEAYNIIAKRKLHSKLVK